jgi:hypothetical protein
VISDVDLLRTARANFNESGDTESVRFLRDALSLVRDLPFSGSNFLWPDSEGVTSNLVHLVYESSMTLADFARNSGQFELAEFAYGVALRMFPGDEMILEELDHAHVDFRKSRAKWTTSF